MKTWQVRGRKGAVPRRRRVTRLLRLCTAAAALNRGGEDTSLFYWLSRLFVPSDMEAISYACLFLSRRMRDLGNGLRSLTFLSVSALLADPDFLDQL